MVSELDTGRCASEEVESQKGVDKKGCASKDVGPLVGSHIDWRRE